MDSLEDLHMWSSLMRRVRRRLVNWQERWLMVDPLEWIFLNINPREETEEVEEALEEAEEEEEEALEEEIEEIEEEEEEEEQEEEEEEEDSTGVPKGAISMGSREPKRHYEYYDSFIISNLY